MSETEEFSNLDKNYLSTFNDSKLQILRLHNSWVKCSSYREKGKLIKWNFELDAVWDELRSKAMKKGMNTCPKIIRLLDSQINKYEVDCNQRKIYAFLRRKQQFLKWVQDEVGMGIKMASDDDEEIEE